MWLCIKWKQKWSKSEVFCLSICNLYYSRCLLFCSVYSNVCLLLFFSAVFPKFKTPKQTIYFSVLSFSRLNCVWHICYILSSGIFPSSDSSFTTMIIHSKSALFGVTILLIYLVCLICISVPFVQCVHIVSHDSSRYLLINFDCFQRQNPSSNVDIHTYSWFEWLDCFVPFFR